MPDAQPLEETVTVACQSIELLLTGKPDVPYKWGSGSLRPDLVVFVYRQDGIRAHLYGTSVNEDSQLTGQPCDQRYGTQVNDTSWPDWLVELADDHDPRTVSSVPAPAVDRSTVLNEAADQAERVAESLRAHHEFERSTGALDVMSELRRLAVEARETEAHPPTHAWKVESPRRGQWASWGATHDERVWATASYDDTIEAAPQRPFRLVRATTTYAVEAEHQPAAGPAGGVQQSEPVVTVHAAPDLSPAAAEALGALVDVAKRQAMADGDRIVAYRSPLPGAWSIYCTRHTDELGAGVTPLTADDLPDGGVCASCGADVLIPQRPKGEV